MEAIRTQINKNPLIAGAIAGAILGLIIGLIFGCVIWPVEYVGAYPRDLVDEEKEEYMRMSIEAYGFTKDAAQAKLRYDALEEGDQILTEVVQNPGTLPPSLILEYSSAVTGSQAVVSPQTPVPGTPPVTPGVEATPVVPVSGTVEEEPQEERSLLSILLPVLCVLLLAIAGVLAWLFIQQPEGSEETAPVFRHRIHSSAAWTDYSARCWITDRPIPGILQSWG
jgi:hypothetical protein